MMKCGCGEEGRYVHFLPDGEEVYSCNKYRRCPTYDELAEKVRTLTLRCNRYESTLKEIVVISAMDYEYRTWAKEALNHD